MRHFFYLASALHLIALFHTVDSSWWYLSQLDIDSVIDPRYICHVIPDIPRRQKQICSRYPHIILRIGEGTRQAIDECKYQFKFHKWDCTTFDRDPSVFGKFMIKGSTRELAFLNAITTASAAYSLAKACSSGTVRCPCSLKNKALLESSKIMETCKCHGLSGSCTSRTCWRPLPVFRHIGDKLRVKYNEAIKIAFSPIGRSIVVDRHQKRPSKYSLIYLEESPDYCSTNHSKGVVGTANRMCAEDSDMEDSCDILCCGRGHDSVKKSTTSACKCKFIWCCEVICEKCTKIQNVSHCKPPKKVNRTLLPPSMSTDGDGNNFSNRQFVSSSRRKSSSKRNLQKRRMGSSSVSIWSPPTSSISTFFEAPYSRDEFLSATTASNARILFESAHSNSDRPKKWQRKSDYNTVSRT